MIITVKRLHELSACALQVQAFKRVLKKHPSGRVTVARCVRYAETFKNSWGWAAFHLLPYDVYYTKWSAIQAKARNRRDRALLAAERIYDKYHGNFFGSDAAAKAWSRRCVLVKKVHKQYHIDLATAFGKLAEKVED